jgi:hypothetical protein
MPAPVREAFGRVVLARPWLAFIVMCLAFLGFGVGTLNLLHLLGANAQFLLENGWMAVLDGGLRQSLELLANGAAAMASYVVFKTCEHAMVDWLAHPRTNARGDAASPHEDDH